MMRTVAECRGGTGVEVSGDQISVRPASDEATAQAAWLKCAHCGSRVARTSDRIEVNSHHEHTFINPVGVIYKIGCFKVASGVIEVGPSTTEFSWFSGHSWRCLACGGCEVHLGWSFTAVGSCFLGLILSQLCEDESTLLQ